MWWFSRIILTLAVVNSGMLVFQIWLWQFLSEAELHMMSANSYSESVWPLWGVIAPVIWLGVWANFKRFKFRSDFKERMECSERESKIVMIWFCDVNPLVFLISTFFSFLPTYVQMALALTFPCNGLFVGGVFVATNWLPLFVRISRHCGPGETALPMFASFRSRFRYR